MGKAVRRKSKGRVREFLWPAEFSPGEKLYGIFAAIGIAWSLLTAHWLYAGIIFGGWVLLIVVIEITRILKGK